MAVYHMECHAREGYNVGPTGALNEARNPQAKWAYASAVLAGEAELQKILG